MSIFHPLWKMHIKLREEIHFIEHFELEKWHRDTGSDWTWWSGKHYIFLDTFLQWLNIFPLLGWLKVIFFLSALKTRCDKREGHPDSTPVEKDKFYLFMHIESRGVCKETTTSVRWLPLSAIWILSDSDWPDELAEDGLPLVDRLDLAPVVVAVSLVVRHLPIDR